MGQARIRKQNGTLSTPNGKNNTSSKSARYFLRQLTGIRRHMAQTKANIKFARGER